MKSKLKAKILLFVMMSSVICSWDGKVWANIDPEAYHATEMRDENGLNRQLFDNVNIGFALAVENDLRRGADIHALDDALQTPLHFVIRRIFEAEPTEGNFLGVLDVLLARGADPEFRVNMFTERNLQTPYDYFETHYSNYWNQALVAAVRERLDHYRLIRHAPARQRRRVL